ncbi:MAG: hypothetical protein ACRESZ_10615 [Methylococcales bacterium]
MKRFILDQSNTEFYTSHSGLALVVKSNLAVMQALGGQIAELEKVIQAVIGHARNSGPCSRSAASARFWG